MSTAAAFPDRSRAASEQGEGGPLRLTRPFGRVFPRRRPPALAGAELQFMTGFLAAFGKQPDHERFANGGGNGFIDMAAGLLDGLAQPLPALDNVMLAYHLPDMKVFEVAGCYLAERCPGSPEVLSVSGQGVGAPFTALRILQGLRLSGRGADGAVLVLDQSTLPYSDRDLLVGQSRDCAVLMRTTPAQAADAVEIDFLAEFEAADPGPPLDALARELPEAVFVIGRMLADRLDPDLRLHLHLRRVLAEGPPDLLCTGVWTALGEHWASDRYTVVADYDPYSARLFQVGLRPGATP